eukprot:5129746-Prymnesium_polylepis.1
MLHARPGEAQVPPGWGQERQPDRNHRMDQHIWPLRGGVPSRSTIPHVQRGVRHHSFTQHHLPTFVAVRV